MMNLDLPMLVVFCGPDGAGKSTFRRLSLDGIPIPFVNVDEIALQEFGSEEAASHAYEAAEIETVLSDPHGAKINFLRKAMQSGYSVMAHFIGLESPELSRARVIQRVHAGGHDVPDEKIAARYQRVMANLQRLLDVPDELVIYDNSSASEPFRVIAKLRLGALAEVRRRVPEWAAFLNLPARQTSSTLILP